MPRLPRQTSSALTLQLQSRGALTARELAQALDVSQPTISRLITSAGPSIERIGDARTARYALRRTVRNAGGRWPVARIDEHGRARNCGELIALHGGFRLVPTNDWPEWLERAYPDGMFSGLPFFLSDLRPQGFLGRLVARSLAAELSTPLDPRAWSDDDVVAWLVARGDDAAGDIVVGERAVERALHAGVPSTPGNGAMPIADRERRYPERADAAMQGEMWGSSAGGEQPKFLATVAEVGGAARAVLIKFSPPMNTPAGRRWADLLVAEAHALAVLHANGVAASRAEIIDAGGRRFLEVTRFDRTASGGRRGVMTLAAVEAGLIEETVTEWDGAARALHSLGYLNDDGAADLRRRWCFGRLIANTDMHFGNVSLWWRDALPFELAPVYDMLPMLFAPTVHGEIVAREFAPPPPLPALHADWTRAAVWACEYWERVADDARVSDEFRAIAARAHDAVAAMQARFT